MDGSEERETSFPSFFGFISNHFPAGAEIVEFVSPEGRIFSGEELKAIEWQEKQKMDIQGQTKVPDNLRQLLSEIEGVISKPKFVRQVKKCFHMGNTFIVIANDDTAWYLRRMDKNTGADFWEQLHDAVTPPLPQGEGVA